MGSLSSKYDRNNMEKIHTEAHHELGVRHGAIVLIFTKKEGEMLLRHKCFHDYKSSADWYREFFSINKNWNSYS